MTTWTFAGSLQNYIPMVHMRLSQKDKFRDNKIFFMLLFGNCLPLPKGDNSLKGQFTGNDALNIFDR